MSLKNGMLAVALMSGLALAACSNTAAGAKKDADINADKARTCVVIKRSLSPGFAGIPNPLFAADNTLMLFADGKQAVLDILAALKQG